MDEAKIKQFLGLLGRKHTHRTTDWVMCSCVLAPWKHKSGKDSTPSFGIHIDKAGKSYYNCYSCNSGGPLDGLLMELLHLNKNGDVQIDLAGAYKMLEDEEEGGFHELPDWSMKPDDDTKKFEPFPEHWLDSFPKAETVPSAMHYLIYGRKQPIPLKIIREFEIRYDAKRHLVGLPFRNRQGVLAGMRGRYINPVGDQRYHDYDYKGHSNTSLTFFNEHRIDWDKPIILVEGAFDTAAVFRWYGNVMSPQTAGMSVERIKKLSLAPEILCFFDNDKAGQQITDKIRKYIGDETIVKQIFYPNSTEEKDASDLPALLLSSILAEYVEIREFLDSI